MNTGIPVISFAYFLEYVLFFLDDNMDDKRKQFSNSKV